MAITSDDPTRALRIAVIALPSFSNFTDFDALRAEPCVSVRLCRNSEQLTYADVIIIPGSKQTADDLTWIRSVGLDRLIVGHASKGLVIGICAGMQMLGEEISDPHGMEHRETIAGLGLLAIHTTMQPQKVTKISSGRLLMPTLFGQPIEPVSISGYEIHVGDTRYLKGAEPFARLSTTSNGTDFFDGCVAADNRTFGTYLHGLFDDDSFRHAFPHRCASLASDLAIPTHLSNWKRQREASLNRLTDTVRTSFDLPKVFAWVGLTYNPQGPMETPS